jgi:hypothetical protein
MKGWTGHMDLVEPPVAFFGRKSFYCHVHPRYSAGSGAMVPDWIALKVAREEREDYERVLSGVEGEESRKRAEVLGLRGIAVAMAEHGSGRKFRWLIYDLVTGECYRRHHDSEIPDLGFRHFRELPAQAQRAVNLTGRESDYERTFWKFENLVWVQYQPELVRVEGR